MQTTLKESKGYQMSINMLLETLELINLANEDCKDCVKSSEEHSHLVINYVYSEMPNTNIFFSSQIKLLNLRAFQYDSNYYYYSPVLLSSIFLFL